MRVKFFLLSLLLPLLLPAQTIPSISQHYTEVNKKINESIAVGFEGPLYNNHWENNKHGKSWPAVGRFAETIDFWYDDDPNHLPALERDPKNVLLKIMVKRISSHLQVTEEYLYKDGKLVFYFSIEAEEGNSWETRVWLNNTGKPIKTVLKENGKELSEKEMAMRPGHRDMMADEDRILKFSKKYQDLFIQSMW